jgi:hypothetical protein
LKPSKTDRGDIYELLAPTNVSVASRLRPNLTTMRLNILALCFALAGANAQTLVDGCPKGNYDCLDVINSSQCLEQLIIEKNAPLTQANMAKCVEFYDSVTNNTGAYKVSFKII